MDALNKFSGVAHWLPRAALAGIFLYHGLIKFPVAEGMASMMGMPVIVVYLLAAAETAGGLLILYGGTGPEWATRSAGLIFSVVMLGAIGMVHAKNGWNSVNMGPDAPGMGAEFQTLILATGLYFAIKGNSTNASHV